jgi:chemotaxis protein MotB
MNQIRIRAAGLALAAALAAGACVTQQSYDKLAAEKGGEIDALKLEQKRLEGETAKLQAQIKDLEAQRAQLEQQQAELRSQVGALEQEKTQLKSASEQTQQQYTALVGSLNEEVKKGELQVRQYKDMLTVNVAEQVFFDSGKATLKSSGVSVLEKVGQALKGYDDKVIRVVGHTDNVPVSKALQQTFPSNWELSVARATTVVRYLEKAGIPPERMIAAGRAEFEPVADNSTDEGRRKNRRIEITLLNRELVQETTPAK